MENTTKFAMALAYINNCNEVVEESELDVWGVCTPDQVATTQESMDDFRAARGYTNGGLDKTPFGDVIFWRGVQPQGKGSRRGTLYVMDFGSERCAFFAE